MTQPSPLRERSYQFALNIVQFCRELNKLKEFVISKQLLKCGTSISANIEEAMCAQTKPDFITKFSISYKESSEADFWLRLLRDSNILADQAESHRTSLTSIRKMLTSSLNTLKSK